MTEIDWVLLGRYAAAECTPEERAFVDRLIAEVPAYRAGLAAIEQVTTVQARYVSPVEAREGQWQRVQAQVGIAAPRRPEDQTVPGLPRRAMPLLKVAAAVALAAGVTLGGYLWTRRAVSPSQTTADASLIRTAAGERTSLMLSDGTVVVLGPASTLRLADTYAAGDRTVALDGEAEFTVANDAARPFDVRTEHLVVRDLGTRFAVRAYAADSVADILVGDGQVAVTGDSMPHRETVLLSVGDRAVVGAQIEVTRATGMSIEEFLGPIDRLVFRRTPLHAVIAQVERWQQVEIDLQVPAPFEDAPFVGMFAREATVDQVVRTIAALYNLKIQVIGPRHYALSSR